MEREEFIPSLTRLVFLRLPGYNNPMLKVMPKVWPMAAPARSVFAMLQAALSFVGAGIAGTLWWKDRIGEDVPCSADGGCALVAASRWSHIDLIFWHDVPVALLGLLGYLFLLTLAMIRLGTENAALDRVLHRMIWLVSAGGFLYSWYLQWIAFAKIGAFCLWCRSSAIVMTILYLTATWEWWSARRRGSGEQL